MPAPATTGSRLPSHARAGPGHSLLALLCALALALPVCPWHVVGAPHLALSPHEIVALSLPPLAHARAPGEHRGFILSADRELTVAARATSPEWPHLRIHVDDPIDRTGIARALLPTSGADDESPTLAFSRCSTTAALVSAYFCGAADLEAEGAEAVTLHGVAEIASALHAAKRPSRLTGPCSALCRRAPQSDEAAQVVLEITIFDFEVPAEYFSHVLALYVLPNGTVQIFQSFVNEYTLVEDLANPLRTMNASGLSKFLNRLRLLEKRKHVDHVLRRTYRELFNYDLLLADDEAEDEQLRTGASITGEIKCVVPPWIAAAVESPLSQCSRCVADFFTSAAFLRHDPLTSRHARQGQHRPHAEHRPSPSHPSHTEEAANAAHPGNTANDAPP